MKQTAAAKHAAAYRLRQKEKKTQLGIATVTIELAQGIAARLPDFLKLHGFVQCAGAISNASALCAASVRGRGGADSHASHVRFRDH